MMIDFVLSFIIGSLLAVVVVLGVYCVYYFLVGDIDA